MDATNFPVDIKSVLTEWVELTKNIKTMSKSLRDKRKREKELKKQVKDFMVVNDSELIELREYDVVYSKRKTTASLSKGFLHESIGRYFKSKKGALDPNMQEELLTHVFEDKKKHGVEKDKVVLKALRKKSNKSTEDKQEAKESVVEEEDAPSVKIASI
jgi:hypothetical protein